MKSGISRQALERLPHYFHYIKEEWRGSDYISAPALAARMRLNEVQVRKDLAAVSRRPGIPKKGFLRRELLYDLAEALGYHNAKDAILIGAGHLGQALLSYRGFEEYGVRIVAAIDTAEQVIDGKTVFPLEKLPDLCSRMNIHIGILTVPAAAAQQCCDLLTSCGILAIWNFAPVHLTAPPGVLVHNEVMAASLAVLSDHVKSREEQEQSGSQER